MIPRQKQNRPDGNQGGSAKKVTSRIPQVSDFTQLPPLTGCPCGCPLDHHECRTLPKRSKYTQAQKDWIRDLLVTHKLDRRGRFTTASEVMQ